VYSYCQPEHVIRKGHDPQISTTPPSVFQSLARPLVPHAEESLIPQQSTIKPPGASHGIVHIADSLKKQALLDRMKDETPLQLESTPLAPSLDEHEQIAPHIAKLNGHTITTKPLQQQFPTEPKSNPDSGSPHSTVERMVKSGSRHKLFSAASDELLTKLRDSRDLLKSLEMLSGPDVESSAPSENKAKVFNPMYPPPLLKDLGPTPFIEGLEDHPPKSRHQSNASLHQAESRSQSASRERLNSASRERLNSASRELSSSPSRERLSSALRNVSSPSESPKLERKPVSKGLDFSQLPRGGSQTGLSQLRTSNQELERTNSGLSNESLSRLHKPDTLEKEKRNSQPSLVKERSDPKLALSSSHSTNHLQKDGNSISSLPISVHLQESKEPVGPTAANPSNRDNDLRCSKSSLVKQSPELMPSPQTLHTAQPDAMHTNDTSNTQVEFGDRTMENAKHHNISHNHVEIPELKKSMPLPTENEEPNKSHSQSNFESTPASLPEKTLNSEDVSLISTSNNLSKKSSREELVEGRPDDKRGRTNKSKTIDAKRTDLPNMRSPGKVPKVPLEVGTAVNPKLDLMGKIQQLRPITPVSATSSPVENSTFDFEKDKGPNVVKSLSSFFESRAASKPPSAGSSPGKRFVHADHNRQDLLTSTNIPIKEIEPSNSGTEIESAAIAPQIAHPNTSSVPQDPSSVIAPDSGNQGEL
jgi:hypothetical protein